MQDQLFVYYINNSKLFWLRYMITHHHYSAVFYSPLTNLHHYIHCSVYPPSLCWSRLKTKLDLFCHLQCIQSVSKLCDGHFRHTLVWSVLHFCNWTLDKFPKTVMSSDSVHWCLMSLTYHHNSASFPWNYKYTQRYFVGYLKAALRKCDFP